MVANAEPNDSYEFRSFGRAEAVQTYSRLAKVDFRHQTKVRRLNFLVAHVITRMQCGTESERDRLSIRFATE